MDEDFADRLLAYVKDTQGRSDQQPSIADIADHFQMMDAAIMQTVRDDPRMSLDGDDENPTECFVFIEED